MSDYLPHSRGAGNLKDVLSNINDKLANVNRGFTTIVATGQSGIVPAAIYCHSHDKNLVTLRKEGEQNHGTAWSGKLSRPYIILDDFISSGDTIERLLDGLRGRATSPPRAIILYGQPQTLDGEFTARFSIPVLGIRSRTARLRLAEFAPASQSWPDPHASEVPCPIPDSPSSPSATTSSRRPESLAEVIDTLERLSEQLGAHTEGDALIIEEEVP